MTRQKSPAIRSNNRTAEEAPYLRDKRAAARYLDVSEKTLNDWIYQGKGPRFIKVGGKLVRYRPEDLEAFLESCPSGGGTAA